MTPVDVRVLDFGGQDIYAAYWEEVRNIDVDGDLYLGSPKKFASVFANQPSS
jgi:hypothetical protein